MEELRKAARALVMQVADGEEVSVDALQGFATLVLRCELVHLAQRLQEAPPEFAVRRAMDLASLVLTLGTRARAAAEAPQAVEATQDTSACEVDEGKGESK